MVTDNLSAPYAIVGPALISFSGEMDAECGLWCGEAA